MRETQLQVKSQQKTICSNILRLVGVKETSSHLLITLPPGEFPANIADSRRKTRKILLSTSRENLITGAALPAREGSQRSETFPGTLSENVAISPMVKMNDNNCQLSIGQNRYVMPTSGLLVV